MYFPVGWPKYIKQPQGELREPTYVISSCDRMLFAIVSDEEISIWYCKPAVQIVSYTQSEKTLTQYGKYCKAEWKPDSSTLAVITSKCYIVLFKVDLDISVPNHHCLYVTAESSGRSHSYHGEGSQTTESVPAIKLTLLKQVQLPSQITCCLSIREELAVATEDGHISRLNWSGTENTKASVCLKDLSVAADMLQSRGTKLTIEDGHVVQMEYSPIIGGYCLVMSSGKAVLMMSLAVHRNDGNSSGVWASEMTDAVCQAVNHRYRLIAYGCSGAYGVVYTINEVEGLLEASHKLQVSCKNFPAMSRTVGAVTCMKWTPDGTSLAMVWKRGGFALWSVFGSLLACTVGGDYSFSKDYLKLFPPSVKSMEWGLEGYQLWMIGTQSHDGEDNNQYTTVDHTDIIQLQFAKSSLTVNPCMTNHEHVFLQGEDKLYLNTGDITSRSCQYGGDESQILVGSKQWQFIPISHSYLASNWPIRYSCVDKAGQCVAVAGKTGLAHYALFNRKWKLFGNETQERDMVVSGGIAWWKDFICVACYNIIGHRDEIRCYPRESKLDNTFANIQKVPSQVLLINIFKDTLLIFCVDSHVMIFNLERINTQSNPAVEITRVQEVGLSSYIPHPVCVTGVVLTSVKMDVAPLAASQRTSQSAKDSDSLLLNVAGKLLVFQRDKSGPQIKQKEKSSLQKIKPLPFSSPAVVATNVENLWTTSRSVTGKLQLTEALWLACGCQGMKVWLPLFPKNETQAQNFMSKRIMLPFRVDIYPLAVLFEEAVILGVASDASMFRYAAKSSFHNPSRNLHDLPYCGVERTSQLYLHHILKQLLKRNLGVQALDLARCCTELSYFSHVLELLLHEVLEAEATSKEPIPDPLLPRVVAFIQEFPEYLQTFVQCARKTEVALWPHLFTTVGNPKDLFEECLYSGRLETAASYLIILQNLEKPIASRQHATLLLDSAIEAKQWDLAQDLVRFLKAIDPNDANASPPLAFHLSKMQANSYIGSPPPTECDTFTFSSVSNVSRIRSSSVTAETAAREQQKDKVKLTHTKSDNQMSVKRPSPKPVQTNSSADQVFIDSLLCRHARKLLSTNRLKDLGCFAANIKDFQLVAWLKKENLRSGKVEDFVSALRDLHHQFHWPLPVLSLSAFQQLKSKAYSSPSLANLSLLDEDVPKGGCNGANNTLVPQSGNNKGKPIPKNLSFLSTDTSDDVVLRPQMSKTDESSLATLEISDSSSLFGDFDFLADSCSSLESLTPELELLSQEIISKGPEQSELELRYLFQVLLEGGCLEWALIIAIVLRDSSAVIRTINTASMTDTPLETVARMREGLSYLELWSDTECVGYKPFLHAIRGQIQLLTKIAEQAPPTLKLNPEIINSDAPLEEGQMSPGTMSIHEGDVHPESPTVPEPHKHNECAVS